MPGVLSLAQRTIHKHSLAQHEYLAEYDGRFKLLSNLQRQRTTSQYVYSVWSAYAILNNTKLTNHFTNIELIVMSQSISNRWRDSTLPSPQYSLFTNSPCMSYRQPSLPLLLLQCFCDECVVYLYVICTPPCRLVFVWIKRMRLFYFGCAVLCSNICK